MFCNYDFSAQFFDEMFEADGTIRPHYAGVYWRLSQMPMNQLSERHQAICSQMIKQGITFTLYGSNSQETLERTIPFDPIPRIIPAREWELIETGIKQRVKAINRFIRDVYHEQKILKDGIVPRKLIVANSYFRPEIMNMDVPGGVYIPFSGIDLIRDHNGGYFVLEDNLRTPSGISYLYKNRSLMRNLFPELFDQYNVRSLSQGLMNWRYVKLGHGRDYRDIVPIKGVYKGSGCSRMEVTVDVRKIDTETAIPHTTTNPDVSINPFQHPVSPALRYAGAAQ